MKTVMTLVAFALTLSACGRDSSDNNKKVARGAGGGDQTMVDVTDTTACSGSPRPGATLYRDWRQTLASDALTMEFRVSFDQRQMRTSTTCAYVTGQRLVVDLASRIDVQGNRVQILDEAQDSRTLEVGDDKYTCESEIYSVEATYELVGECLRMTVNGQSELFVP